MAELDAKRVKACIKEGGKKGIDLNGTQALGGVSFFNISMDEAAGELVYLEKTMEGSNLEVDESAEERKGGAGDIGKVYLSAGVETLAVIGHLPAALAEEKSIKLSAWMSAVLKPAGYTVGTKKGECVIAEGDFVKAVIVQDKDAGVFPLKLRDEMISAGVAFLRENSLLPADDGSDSDDYVDDTEW
jgi:hypothetical protein|mmetsp:Transcript_9787/g.16480  ORF Transcript_9787/g.16480 Transcript_9787/m.16480 type:complete len:187 (+) Transcript_9787:107-667(+)|eukprot:CAMPEP_0177777158 /NCGR_PEP_ID=MMETSP0491_2-20121128/15162_1 /TAXON_ID=63592 /ORGANISM="Tetraselmis chuii, Strain PLY429" /LENGTH=186 /DNA_ID=CAMNT_0019296127 /DNA_START=107 /DNA_END=667 /DNA_ORIENTATION=+